MDLSRPLARAFLPALLAAACAGSEGDTVALGPVDGRDLSPTDTGRVAVGDPAPDFVLAQLDGPPVRLSEYRGSKEVVLVFFRGHW